MPEWITLMPVRGNPNRIVASASDIASATQACPEGLALKFRKDLWPDVNGWRKRYDPQPFLLSVILEAIDAAEVEGEDLDEAVERFARQPSRDGLVLHPGLVLYARHAVSKYLDASASLADVTPGMLALPAMMEWPANATATLTTYGRVYETSDGVREVRRLRFGAARDLDDDGRAWAGAAAKVLVDGRLKDRPNPLATPSRVRVVEVGLNDASIVVLFDGSPDAARTLFREGAEPRLRSATFGQGFRPGWGCADCRHLGGCSHLPRVAGALGQADLGTHPRSVSASDLDVYGTCAARYFLERVSHLPKREVRASRAARRGLAVHRWLRAAHSRPGHGPCTDDDLPESDGGSAPGLAADLMTAEEYREARPFLLQHLPHCPFAFPSFTESANEPGHRCYDSDADVVVAATPDLTGRYDSTRVWRETKSTVHALPEDEIGALDTYLAAALDLVLLSILADGAPAVVELEVLGPDAGRVYVLATDDETLLSHARRRVAEAALVWHNDREFAVRPGRQCAWCPVAHFCPANADEDPWAPTAEAPPALEDLTEDDEIPF